MATRLLITSEQAFCLRLCSVASDLVMVPFVMALPPAFMDFIGGSMVLRGAISHVAKVWSTKAWSLEPLCHSLAT